MIVEISLENFKCFPALKLPLRRLTLLTGFNASGKSTTMQTLLLLAQTLRSADRGSDLRLNGPLVRLGSPGDVINQRLGGSAIALGIGSAEGALLWRFRVTETRNGRTLRVEETTVSTNDGVIISHRSPGILQRLLPEVTDDSSLSLIGALDTAIYLSALRQVDSEVFPIPDEPSLTFGDVGALGQYAAWWYHECEDMEIPALRCLLSGPVTLRGQMNAWINEFFPGAEVDVQPVLHTSFLRLCFRLGQTQEWHRPSNVGYGLTYVFPLFVAGLCAAEKQLLMIDSPEAHLHPKGQSRIGRFLAQAACCGPQVIVETHSDHVLNGVRLAINEGVIRPEDVLIHFFHADRSGTSAEPRVTTIGADGNGNLSDWPEGFFDQTEKDLGDLAGWK